MARARKQEREPKGRHHGDIEQERRGRRRREAMQRVEDAAPQRHQRNQQQIRKRDPGQAYRKSELLRLS